MAAVMVSVIDKLCSAIAPKQMGSTPMKKAELRMKQLSGLRQLHDNGVLTEDEYEEQKGGIDSINDTKNNKDKEQPQISLHLSSFLNVIIQLSCVIVENASLTMS